jgi:hypothetical protein
LNSYHYFEFFSSHPKGHLGYGILRGVVTYPYPVDPAHLIGSVYYGSSDTSANANLWADAFSNFGFGGIAGFTIVLAAFLSVYDGIAVHRDLRIAALLIVVPSFALTNTALLTTLLTHGLFLVLILLVLMPKTEPRTERFDGVVAARGGPMPTPPSHRSRTCSEPLISSTCPSRGSFRSRAK